MLAMADRHGRVWASIPGLAKESAVSVDACQTAIDEFLAPDPYSRTKVCEGRRIEPIDGGWRLINHAKYRAIRDEEERRFYKTAKQREYRAVDNVDKSGQVLNDMDASAHNAEAEAEAEAKVQKPSRAKAARATKDSTKTALAKTRHDEFKSIIAEYWDSKNKGVQMPWDGREGKNLEMFLRAAPHITAEQFRGFLRNRFKSEVNHGERASQWIAWVTNYAAGPMDRFGKTIQSSAPVSMPSSAAGEEYDRKVKAAMAEVRQ
jgi:hypothetical protein